MGWTTKVVAGVTLTAFSISLTAEVREGLKHVQLHVPASFYANVGSTAALATSVTNETAVLMFDCTPFRAMYPQAIEKLADDVSKLRPAAGVFTLA